MTNIWTDICITINSKIRNKNFNDIIKNDIRAKIGEVITSTIRDNHAVINNNLKNTITHEKY